MSDAIQVAEPMESPKVWLFLEVMRSELEVVLNAKAKDGYQVYRMDRINENRLVTYDVVFFNPVYMGTTQMEGMQAALRKAGLDIGKTPPPSADVSGPYPGAKYQR